MASVPATVEQRRTITARRPTLLSRLRPTARWLAILLMGGTFGFPLYWTVTMAFKPEDEWNPPGKVFWWPHTWTASNFTDILGIQGARSVFFTGRSQSALTPIEHSLIAAGFGTLLALVVGIFAAYGIARFRAGGRVLPFQILQLRMFPPVAIIIPVLIMYAYLHLVDTYWGLILIYGAVNVPLVIWMMRSFFAEMPRDILEASLVDGASFLQLMRRILLPLSLPGLASTILLCLIFTWNEFLLAVNLTASSASTLPVFISGFQTSEGLFWAKMSAASTLAIAPVIIAGWIAQRSLVRGLTFGAVK